MADLTRVVFFCEDKNVGAALRRLTGVAVQVPEVFPVVNAALGPNGVKAANSNTNLCDLFIQHLVSSGVRDINVAFIREWLSKMGRKPSAAPYVLKCAREAKALKAAGRDKYTVTIASTKKGK